MTVFSFGAAQYLEIMDNLSKKPSKKILVIGDLIIDHYINGSCDRISPEAPVQVLNVKSDDYSLGGAGNVLKNLASLRCQAGIISVSGQDEMGKTSLQEVTKLQPFYFSIIPDKTRRTTVKTRLVSSSHHLLRLDSEDNHVLNEEIKFTLLNNLKDIIDKISILIISDYCKGVISKDLATRAIQICNENNVLVIVDSKDNDISKFINADVIKTNRSEAAKISGIEISHDEGLKLACKKIQNLSNCTMVVVSLGKEGIAFYSENRLEIIPAQTSDVFDITGARDVITASLAFAFSSGANLYDACTLANIAAGIAVRKAGNSPVTIDEINFYQDSLSK